MEPAFARIMGEGHTVEVQGGASTVKEVALTVNCDAQLLSKKGHGTFREKSSQHGAVLEPCGAGRAAVRLRVTAAPWAT